MSKRGSLPWGPWACAGRQRFSGGSHGSGGWPAALDLVVALGDGRLKIVEADHLAEQEDVLRAIVTGQGRDDLRLSGLAALVAVLRQHRGVGLARHDGG